MKSYDNYIFDLDGTLLDTLGDLAASTNYAMRQHGMAEHSIDEVRLMVGNGIGKLIERAVPQGTCHELYEEVFATFKAHYLAHSMDTTQPYEGIVQMLHTLKQQGKNMAVVSNKYCTATEALCRHFFSDTIGVAIGESERIRKKPAPDAVVEAMRLLGAHADNTVYVGDSEVDIATARNCSLPCISVLWGFRDRAFLTGHGATTLVESPMDIIS